VAARKREEIRRDRGRNLRPRGRGGEHENRSGECEDAGSHTSGSVFVESSGIREQNGDQVFGFEQP
jgi:hypothetical protein